MRRSIPSLNLSWATTKKLIFFNTVSAVHGNKFIVQQRNNSKLSGDDFFTYFKSYMLKKPPITKITSLRPGKKWSLKKKIKRRMLPIKAMLPTNTNLLVTVINHKHKCNKKKFIALVQQLGIKFCETPFFVMTGRIPIKGNHQHLQVTTPVNTLHKGKMTAADLNVITSVQEATLLVNKTLMIGITILLLETARIRIIMQRNMGNHNLAHLLQVETF